MKSLLKSLKKNLCCNGCILDHKEYGTVLQIQGDKRADIFNFLKEKYKINENNIEKHGG